MTLESWYTNLDQTPLNRCQHLPAPYHWLLNKKRNLTYNRRIESYWNRPMTIDKLYPIVSIQPIPSWLNWPITFNETDLYSRGAFCLRMLRRKYFDVSNRWYAPVCLDANRKMAVVLTNFSAVFPFVTCVKESENQLNGFVESRRKSQPSPFRRSRSEQTF